MIIYSYNEKTAKTARADLQKKIPVLKARAKMMRALREFFFSEGFLEVETPTMIPTPALEDYIDALQAGHQWLRTSPELHLKRVLAAGLPKIYQIGPCFRKDEAGSRHLTEFTMLEWYRVDANWKTLMDDVTRMVQQAALMTGNSLDCSFLGHRLSMESPWDTMTVEEAFQTYAGISLREAISANKFEETLVEKVEPNLGCKRPLFLTEYPIECSGLSKTMDDNPSLVERWELYCCGVEIANACTELIDPQEQLARFQNTAKLREAENRTVYEIDSDFMDAINLGMPCCAGCAMGLDRLCMVLTGCNTIYQTCAFAP